MKHDLKVTIECVKGKIVSLDLHEQAHVLIYGKSGSGKTTLLKRLITDLIQKNIKGSIRIMPVQVDEEFLCILTEISMEPQVDTNEELSLKIENLWNEMLARFDLLHASNISSYTQLQHNNPENELPMIIAVLDSMDEVDLSTDDISRLIHVLHIGNLVGIHVLFSTRTPEQFDRKLMDSFRCNIRMAYLGGTSYETCLFYGGYPPLVCEY